MKKKLGIVACSLFLSAGALCVAAVLPIPEFNIARAADVPHTHNLKHYKEIAATTTSSGVHEFWVCCTCHEHFLANPGGNVGEGGTTPNITDTTDSRYLFPLSNNEDGLGAELERLGLKYTVDSKTGEYTVTGTTSGKETNTIIPEGVVGVKAGAFKGNSEVYFVVPTSCSDATVDAMFSTGARKCTVFFVGATSYTASTLKCSGVYQILDEGWEYVNGVPTPKK